MASINAAAAVSRAILGLIEEHCPRQLLTNPKFDLYQAASFESPMAEGYSLYLYRIEVGGGSRNRPPRRDEEGGQFRPSLPVDLHYLLTPWASDPEVQQRLLGWTVRFMEDRAVLPAGFLNHYVRETDTFRRGETVEILSDPLALADYLNLWDKLKPKMQTSLPYVVRTVLIDSDAEMPSGAPVQTREFDTGEVAA